MKKIMLLVLLLAVLGARGQDLKQNEFSASVGYMFEGEVYLWEDDFYGSVGETLLIKLEYDHYLGSLAGRFGLGLYYAYGTPWYDGYEETAQHEIGAVLKMRFTAGEKMQIKPGAYFGYRAYGNEAGSGLGINGAVAFQYQGEKVKPFMELGILTQPAGGNDYTDITYSPVFQVSFGVTF